MRKTEQLNIAALIDDCRADSEQEAFQTKAASVRNAVYKLPGWRDVMLEGQLTRDPSLRTLTERREAHRRAQALETKRRKVSGVVKG